MRSCAALARGLIRRLQGLLTPEERQHLLTEGNGRELNAREKEMIRSIFRLRRTEVREIMVPRTDIIAVNEGDNLHDIIGIVTKYGHSRIPVCRETVDRITGILHVKDLLKCVDRNAAAMDPSNPITFFMRPPYFVPENKKIEEAFQEMKARRMHIAVVADEYGGTAGLVTLEDILEEIVGEIEDEYDREEDLFRRIDRNTIELDPGISLPHLNKILGAVVSEDNPDYDTLGGLILSAAGAVPSEKDEIKHQDLKITILKMDGTRIERVRIEKNPV